MNDAVATVVEKFRTYWGQRAANALSAINAALYSGDDLTDEAPADETDTEDENEEEAADTSAPDDGTPYFMRQMGMRLVDNKKKR